MLLLHIMKSEGEGMRVNVVKSYGMQTAKLWYADSKAMVCWQQSYGLLTVQHSCTVGIPMLNSWYQIALLFWYFC